MTWYSSECVLGILNVRGSHSVGSGQCSGTWLSLDACEALFPSQLQADGEGVERG